MHAHLTPLPVSFVLVDGGTAPTYAHDGDAGFDLRARIDEPLRIYPACSVIVPLGVKLELPKGFALLLMSRSGHGRKNGLRLANSVGLIDPTFTGELSATLHNDSRTVYELAPNEKVCQGVIVPFWTANLCQVDSLTETERGENGHGSTGT